MKGPIPLMNCMGYDAGAIATAQLDRKIDLRHYRYETAQYTFIVVESGIATVSNGQLMLWVFG